MVTGTQEEKNETHSQKTKQQLVSPGGSYGKVYAKPHTSGGRRAECRARDGDGHLRTLVLGSGAREPAQFETTDLGSEARSRPVHHCIWACGREDESTVPTD